MRFLCCIVVSLLLSLNVSADELRSLEWLNTNSTGNSMPDFKGSVFKSDSLLPFYAESYFPVEQADNYKVSITYPIYEEVGGKDLKYLRKQNFNFPDSINLKVSSAIQRKNKVLDISFLPFIKKGNSYYRLSSFSLKVLPAISSLRSATSTNSIDYASSSVLAKGKWKKISVTGSGLYKLTWQEIKNMGIDPEKVQVYGYGGAMLEEDFSKPGYHDDLPEVSIWKEKGSDGIFNSGDFILFYAQGPVSWKKDSSTGMYVRVRNPYSDKAYYFIGEREGGSKVAEESSFDGVPNKEVTDYTDFILHESDKVNMGESVAGKGTGRELYGEDFVTSPSQTFNFDISGADMTQPSRIMTEFAAHNTATQYCYVKVDGEVVNTLNIGGVSASNAYTYANSAKGTAYFTPSSGNLNVNLNYYINGNSATPRAYLNYIILNLRKYLKLSGSSFTFRDPQSVGTGNVAKYTIQDANASTVVFDVTDPLEMSLVKGNLSGTNYTFNSNASSLKEFVCADLKGSIPEPVIEGSVANQNIHGNQQFDMAIISPAEFLAQARRLAQAHVSHDGLSVLVVTPEQVYNEFSSGTPDATAYRRMMKLFYDRGTSDNDIPKYLLLFGGGVYDNRMVSSMFSNSPSKSTKLLTYQSAESLEGTSSYVTDDYFGFLDDTEGADLADDRVDIGVGRFTVYTAGQAKIAVDKTLEYMENSKKGTWKNRLLFLADDGDDNTHMEQAETLASKVESSNPEFVVNRIYVDAYKKVKSASGSTIPDANNKFSELLNSGLLLLNYTGHGSTRDWTAEKLLTLPDVQNMTNKCLPLWVTATCDFSRYDASETSGGETAFLNPNGGAIALFTTTRIVYSANNFIINKIFIDNIFSRKNGVRNSLGEIMYLTKNSENLNNDRNKLSFTLIGDPALKLAYPEYFAKVTKVNGTDIKAVADTFQALGKVRVEGEVYREDGTFANDFKGLVSPTVYDAKELVNTFGSDGADVFSFYDRSKVLFTGKDSVENGKFSFDFVLPKDISYSYKTGKINLYAYDPEKGNEAQGNYENFVIGGTNSAVGNDTIGPDIRLYLNDTSFVSGGTVNETPTLIALVHDESGLNTSGNGIGHDFEAIIDDNPDMSYVLNNYYSGSIGSYNSGMVQYVLPELSSGSHSLQFRAWDVQNNSSVSTIKFKVVPGKSPALSDLRYVQQGESVLFRFVHNRPDITNTVKLEIYDILGRLVWRFSGKMQSEGLTSDEFEWNMTNLKGEVVPGGIYICKVILTDSNGADSAISEKIRLLPQ